MRKGESRKDIVEDLFDPAEDLVHVENVLMDREFDSQHLLAILSQCGLSYVILDEARIRPAPTQDSSVRADGTQTELNEPNDSTISSQRRYRGDGSVRRNRRPDRY